MLVHPDSCDQGAQNVAHRRVRVPDAHDESPPEEKGREGGNWEGGSE